MIKKSQSIVSMEQLYQYCTVLTVIWGKKKSDWGVLSGVGKLNEIFAIMVEI